MKLAVHKDEPVRIVEPAAAGREVQLLTLGFSVDVRIEIRTILYPPAGNYPVEQRVRDIVVLTRESDRLPDKRVEMQRAVEVRLPFGQSEIKLGELLSGRFVGYFNVPHTAGVLDWEVEGRGGQGEGFCQHDNSPFLSHPCRARIKSLDNILLNRRREIEKIDECTVNPHDVHS